MKKIFISGPSGVGKTTLARWIESFYNMEYIDLSSKNVWDDLKVKSHSELINKSRRDIAWGIDAQFEILNWRIKRLSGVNHDFVTDRGPVDNLYYFLYELGHECTTIDYENFTEILLDLYSICTHYIFIEFSPDIPKIEDDGARIPKRFYQKFISDGMKGVFNGMTYGNVKKLNIHGWDLGERKNHTVTFLSQLDLF